MTNYHDAASRRDRDLLLGVYLARYGFVDSRRLGRAASYWRTEPWADLGWALVRDGAVAEQAVMDVRAFLEHEIAARGGVGAALDAYGGEAAALEAFGGLVPALPVMAQRMAEVRPPALAGPSSGEPGPVEPSVAGPEGPKSGPMASGAMASESGAPPLPSPGEEEASPAWGGGLMAEEEEGGDPLPMVMSEGQKRGGRWPWLLLGLVFAGFLVVIGALVVYQFSGVSEYREAENRLKSLMDDYDKGKGGPETEAALNQFILERPENPFGYYFRSYYYQKEGKYREAIADLDKCLELDKNFYGAVNNLAWILATCPSDEFRDGKRAVELARRACELTKWKDSGMIDTLAAAYAEIGDFELAVKWQEEALNQYDPQDGDEKMLAGLKSRLELYQSGQAFREEPRQEAEPSSGADDK